MDPLPDRYGPNTVELAGRTTGRGLEIPAAVGTTAASGLNPTSHPPSFVHPTTDCVTDPVRPVVSPR